MRFCIFFILMFLTGCAVHIGDIAVYYDDHTNTVSQLKDDPGIKVITDKTVVKEPIKEVHKTDTVPTRPVIYKSVKSNCSKFTIPPIPPEPIITDKDLSDLDQTDKNAVTKKLLEQIRKSHNHHVAVSKLYYDAIKKHKEVCDEK